MSWKEEQRDRARELREGKTFGLVEGDNYFRIHANKLDAPKQPGGIWTSDREPCVEFYVHRNVGPDERFVGCGINFKTNTGKCWLCHNKIPELEKGDSKQKAMAAEIVRKRQFLVQVSRVDPSTKKFFTPKPWWVSTTKSNKSLDIDVRSFIASQRRDYTHPINGYNATLERTGMQWNNTRYGHIIPDEDPTSVPAVTLALLEYLDDFIPKYDPEEQQAAFYGRDRRDDRGGSAPRGGNAPRQREEPAPAQEPEYSAEGEGEGGGEAAGESWEEPTDEFSPDQAEEGAETPFEEPEGDPFEEPAFEEQPEPEPEPEPEPAPPPPPRRTAPALAKPAAKPPAKPAPPAPAPTRRAPAPAAAPPPRPGGKPRR